MTCQIAWENIIGEVLNLLRLNCMVDVTNIDILEIMWISWKSDPSHGTIEVTRVYAPWFLSRHNKDLEWRTWKPPGRVTAIGSWTDRVIALRPWTDRVIPLRQISVTALFYLEDSRKIHLRGMRAWGHVIQRHEEKSTPACGRVRELALAPLFICFSLPGPVLCKLGQSGVLFVLPEVLTPVLRPSCVLFSRAFLFLIL